MMRVVLTLAATAALAFAAPAAADPSVEFCGITPRIPCGVCVDDQTCVGLRDGVR